MRRLFLFSQGGFTPLSVAVQQTHHEVATVLLEAEAGSRFQLPALHVAAKKDDVKSLSLLLRNKHDPNIVTKVGCLQGNLRLFGGREVSCVVGFKQLQFEKLLCVCMNVKSLCTSDIIHSKIDLFCQYAATYDIDCSHSTQFVAFTFSAQTLIDEQRN